MINRYFILPFAVLCCVAFSLQAQTSAFNFQAVMRDAQNQPLTNRNIRVRASILNVSNTAVYVETHSNVSTGAAGIFTLSIGTGTRSGGTVANLDAINWSAAGGYSLRVEVDPNNSSNFTTLQTTPLLSVPYAMYARQSGSVSGGLSGTGTANTIPKFGTTNTLTNSVITENNGNIGIGVAAPTRGKLEVFKNTGTATTNAILGFGQAGLSFQQNCPTIGWNQYTDAPTGNGRYMSNGQAMTQFYCGGSMFWKSWPTGTANQTISGTGTNILTLESSGNLGINNANPDAKLDVTVASGKDIEFTTILGAPTLNFNGGATSNFIGLNGGTLGIFGANCQVAMNVGVPNSGFVLDVNGTACKSSGGSSWSVCSDLRLKKDIKPFSDGLATILKINPIAFHYNGLLDLPTEPLEIGVVAQELQEIAPHMVTAFKGRDGNQYLSVNPSSLDYMFVNAFKEQQNTIENQQEEIAGLKTALGTQQQKTEALERQMTALQGQIEALLGKSAVKSSKKK
jgi:FtsZ-binding cell division protein ZapB